jgi:hypothetical protein
MCFLQNQNREVITSLVTVGTGADSLSFRNVKVTKPLGCTVEGIGSVGGSQGSEVVTTGPLTFHADWMDTAVVNQHGVAILSPPLGPCLQPCNSKACLAQLQANSLSPEPSSAKQRKTQPLWRENDPLVFSAAVQTTTGATLKPGPTNVTTLTGTAMFSAMAGFFGVKWRDL